MGIYINPQDMSKEEWLAKHGDLLAYVPELHTVTKRQVGVQDKLVVCLVDNGWMTAAAIVYSQDELRAFTYEKDLRPKKWYSVAVDDLKEFGIEKIKLWES
jgi:hypothetical protein